MGNISKPHLIHMVQIEQFLFALSVTQPSANQTEDLLCRPNWDPRALGTLLTKRHPKWGSIATLSSYSRTQEPV